MKKSNIFKAFVACMLVCSVAVAKDGKYKGSEKNTAHRQAQLLEQTNKAKSNKSEVTYQYTIGEDNINLLCTGVSSFGNNLVVNTLGEDTTEGASNNIWTNQQAYINAMYSDYFSDYELPDYLGGVYVYNNYGTQYIWAGGEQYNPVDGWRNSCDLTTCYAARTIAQALYPDRADRINFAFYVDYANWGQIAVAQKLADASLPSEFSYTHWRYFDREVNGFTSRYGVYTNYKLSLQSWYSVVCIVTSRGLTPVYVEHLSEKVIDKELQISQIQEHCQAALDRYAEALSAFALPEPENFNGDPEDDFMFGRTGDQGYEDYTGDADPVHDDSGDEPIVIQKDIPIQDVDIDLMEVQEFL